MSTSIDRRSFVRGVAAAGAAAVAGNAAAGMAEEAGGQNPVAIPTSGEAEVREAAQTAWGNFDEYGNFTPSFLLPPEPIPADQVVSEGEVDIVVVGMGLAGMSAAREAIEEGAEVFVIEKGDTHHVHSHQFHAINSKVMKQFGYEMSQEQIDELLAVEMHDHRDRVDRRIWEYLFNHCGEDFDWYIDTVPHVVVNPEETVAETELDAKAICNICTSGLAALIGRYFDDVSQERMDAALEAAPYIVPFNRPVNPNWDFSSERYPMSANVVQIEPNHAKVGAAVAKIIEDGARVEYACWGRRLVQDDTGRVTGVIYEDIDGGFHQINARKGVMLMTGDYGGNPEMIRYYMPRVLEDGDWLGWPDRDARGDVTNIGEGLQMAHWVGARTDYCHAFPNDHYGGGLGMDPVLFVDGSGERFMNEDVSGEVLGEKVSRINGRVAWQIFDADYASQLDNMPVGHRCFWKVEEDYDQIPLGLFFDPIGIAHPKEVDFCSNVIADTIEELAEGMGVPLETLQATIDRYNELYDKGVDEDFGKRADRLTPIKTPPFHASRMGTLGYQTFYGSVCCDYNMHAVDMNNEPIPGLYVAGTIMGSRFYHVYPNTAMGMNHTGALCYGRLAAKNALAGI